MLVLLLFIIGGYKCVFINEVPHISMNELLSFYYCNWINFFFMKYLRSFSILSLLNPLISTLRENCRRFISVSSPVTSATSLFTCIYQQFLFHKTVLLHNGGYYNGCITKQCLHNSTNVSYNDLVSW